VTEQERSFAISTRSRPSHAIRKDKSVRTSGDSRMKRVGGHWGAKKKVGGQHKYLSCMVIFHCFDD